MKLVRTVAPSAAVVSVEEARRELRIEHADDDALLADLIAAAADTVEQMTGRALVTQTWRAEMRRPPAGCRVVLPRPPVQSLSAVAWLDSAGAEQSASVDEFDLLAYDDAAYLRPVVGGAWPPAVTGREDALRVTFVAGFGGAADVPAALRQAVLAIVAHDFGMAQAPGAEPAPWPPGIMARINAWRVGWVGG